MRRQPDAAAAHALSRLAAALLALLLLLASWSGRTAHAADPLTAGVVLTVDPAAGAVTLNTAAGTAAYRVPAWAELIVYDRPARLQDLLPGLSVWFAARNGDLTHLTAPAAGQPPAAAPPVTGAPHRVAGRLQYADANSLAVITATGEVEAFQHNAQTAAYRDGAPAVLRSLDPGDPVAITVSAPGQTYALRVDATTAPRPAVAVYRGRVESAWPNRLELVLAGTELLSHGQWRPAAPWLQLPLDVGAPVYLQGDRRDLDAVAREGIGQTAYVAVAADGSGRVLKASVMPSASLLFNATPTGVVYGTGELLFAADYGSVGTAASSLLVRNGRLVDFYGLAAEGSYTVSLGPPPGTGLPGQPFSGLGAQFAAGQFAAVAVQETFLPYGLELVWGQVETAGAGQVTLRYPHAFGHNEFGPMLNHTTRRERLTYGLAVQGRDHREAGAPRRFDRFELDRQPQTAVNVPGQLRNSWVLTASLHGELLALEAFSAPPVHLDSAMALAGTIAEAGAGQLVLTDLLSWNSLSQRWEPGLADWTLQTPARALWIGADGPVDPAGISPGTPVTVVGDGFNAHIIMIR